MESNNQHDALSDTNSLVIKTDVKNMLQCLNNGDFKQKVEG